MNVTRQLFILMFVSISVATCMNIDYLTSKCVSSNSLSKTRLLLSNYALMYSNSMTCQYTVTTTSPRYRVIAVFRNFDMEIEQNGACVDYVNVYDGSSTSDTRINTSPLCGSTGPGVMTSAGRSMTLEFVTDSSARLMGIDVVFSEFYNGSCVTDEFSCSNGYCVDTTLKCDEYEQCGDASDEISCAGEDGAGTLDNTALIAGLCIGIGALIIIGVAVGMYVYREYRWKKFLRDPLPAMQKWNMGDNYPVTQQYYKTGHKNMGYASISEPYKDFDTDDEGASSSKSSMDKILISVPKSGHSKA